MLTVSCRRHRRWRKNKRRNAFVPELNKNFDKAVSAMLQYNLLCKAYEIYNIKFICQKFDGYEDTGVIRLLTELLRVGGFRQ